MTSENSLHFETKLRQVKHRRPMLLPEEGFTDEDLLAFDRSLREHLGRREPLQYTVEPKIRGVSAQMAYKAGRLSLATTIGNGYEGEVITGNIKTILTVPLTLWLIGDAPPIPEYLEVRGEVYMETPAFETFNRNIREKGLPVYKDAKEAAEDSLRQVNPRITARRPLNMFCSCVGEVKGFHPSTSYEMMVVLQSWGFRVNRPHIRICDTPDEMLQACYTIRGEKKEYPFEVEGALIKLNRLDLREPQGSEADVKAWAFVYRF